MQRIKNISLPKKYPTDKAIKSCGHNIHNYEPEFWEFQYEIFRYLKNVEDAKLNERHKALCKNLAAYSSESRDVIPIDSFQSSWYWFRKEHQTRYEFFLRKLPLPDPPTPRQSINKPYPMKRPTGCDILYRYGYLKPITSFLELGYTKIKPASAYKDGISTDPRTDDEKNKERFYLGEYTSLITQSGDRIPVIGDIKSSVSACDYYVLCLSYDYEPLIFNKFSYDACLIIKNPKQFSLRLETEFKKFFPNWYFFDGPIQYFDPYEHTKNECFSPGICKDFSFAYQKEYRFILDPLKPANELKKLIEFNIELGPLGDICELHVVKT